MRHKHYLVVSGAIFLLITLGHLIRIIDELPVLVGDYTIPMLASWVVVVVFAALAIWAFRLLRGAGQ